MTDGEKNIAIEFLMGVLGQATTYFPDGFYNRLSLTPKRNYAYPTVIVGMTLASGMEIEFSAEMDGYRTEGRIEFGHHLDHTLSKVMDYDQKTIEITVAKDKEPRKIAADLLRRFLPEYTKLYVELTSRRDRDRAYRIKKDANVQQLSLIVNVEARGGQGQDDDKEREILLVGAGAGRAYGNGQVMGDSVNLNLNNLSLSEAEHVLKYLSSGAGRLFDRPV